MMYINNLLACSCTSCDSEKDSRPISGFSVLTDALAPKQDSVADVAPAVPPIMESILFATCTTCFGLVCC